METKIVGGVVMIIFRGLYLLLVLVAAGVFSGCASQTFQPYIFKDGKFNSGYVADTAKSSANIFDFVGKVYVKHERMGDVDLIKKVYNPDYESRVNYNILWDTYIYETYCKSKLGKLFNFYMSGKQYYICETDKGIESAIGYYKGYIFNGKRDTDQRWYSLQAMTPNFFINDMNSNQNEYYYTNTDKNINLNYFPSPSYSNSFRILFKYKNIGSSPISLDLDDVKIICDGKGYKVDVKRDRFLDAELKKRNTSIITINPGEESNYEFILNIRGLKELVSDRLILNFGDTIFDLKKRVRYEDREPFAVNVDKNNIL